MCQLMENKAHEQYARSKVKKAKETLLQRHTHCLIFLMK